MAKRLINDFQKVTGKSAIEYVSIAALIALVILSIVRAVGENIGLTVHP